METQAAGKQEVGGEGGGGQMGVSDVHIRAGQTHDAG